MWTWDSTEITHDQTCWTYDGYDGCAQDTGGSGGYRRGYRRAKQAYVNNEHVNKVVDDIKQLITADSGSEFALIVDDIPQPISSPVAEAVIRQSIISYDPLPSMNYFDIGLEQAIERHRLFVAEYLERMNDDAIAIILIIGTI